MFLSGVYRKVVLLYQLSENAVNENEGFNKWEKLLGLYFIVLYSCIIVISNMHFHLDINVITYHYAFVVYV